MNEPVVESMADVRRHLAEVINRARHEDTPTIITRRGKQEAVVIDIQEYRRLRQLAGDAVMSVAGVDVGEAWQDARHGDER